MSPVKVSVIVPIYNAEAYLYECITSIVKQSLKEIEVILINDGSTDSSLQIIESFAEKYNFIKIINQENMGVTKTRAKGLRIACGQYIAWVDSDDLIEECMLEVMYNKAIEEEAEFISCNYDFFPQSIATKEKWFKNFKGEVNWDFIERNTQQWNKLVSKSLLDRLDMSYWMEYCGEGAYAFAIIKANKIVTLTEVLYHYRVGHNSLSNNFNKTSWYINNIKKVQRQYEGIVKLDLEKTWGEYFRYRIDYAIILTLIVASKNSEPETYNTFINVLRNNKFKNNKYLSLVLDNNFGKIKSFVIRNIICCNYALAHMITRYGLRS